MECSQSINDDKESDYRCQLFLKGIVDTLEAVSEGHVMVHNISLSACREVFVASYLDSDGTELELRLDVRVPT